MFNNLNPIDRLQRTWVAVGVAAVGLTVAVINKVDKNQTKKKLKKAYDERETFQTPKEVFDILNTSEFRAQTGFDAKSLAYLTNQADRGFATNTGTALRLGADPNIIAGLDDKYLQDIMKIGSDNAMLQLENFDKYIQAKQLVAANKEAEWASADSKIKDLMAAYAGQIAASQQNINAGIGLIGQGASMYAQNKLYADQKTPNVTTNIYNSEATGGGWGGGGD